MIKNEIERNERLPQNEKLDRMEIVVDNEQRDNL